ncbi:MAG: DUF167 domain-containing protein [Thermoleophilia bacterium]
MWRSTPTRTSSSGRVLSASPEGSLLKVRVVPGARKSQLAGESAGRLRVRLMAPPVEGKANLALLRYLADVLGIRKNRVSLVSGERSREKTVLLAGVSLVDARAGLDAALKED